MESNNSNKSLTAELLMDVEHVCIPLDRYEQLVAAEANLAIVKKANNSLQSYEVQAFLKVVFGCEAAGGDGDA